MQSEQVVDVLTLPQLTMVTRLTAASLRSLAGLLNSLADTLGRVEVVAEKVEMVSDEVEVMTDQESAIAVVVIAAKTFWGGRWCKNRV